MNPAMVFLLCLTAVALVAAHISGWLAGRRMEARRGRPYTNERLCHIFFPRQHLEHVGILHNALEHALEWLEEQGCDCGTDEPGTCALCEAKAALAAVPWPPGSRPPASIVNFESPGARGPAR